MSSGEVSALGIDVGSTTFKLVAVDTQGSMLWHILEPSQPRLEEQARRVLQEASAKAGRELDEGSIVATGYGRNLVPAGRRVTEITCHARGVFAATGHGGTLVDIGGQDSKVIVIGSDGRVTNFVMNDKCAAGTGRFLEVAATRLELDLDELGRVALESEEEVSISSTCTVFAESEIVSQIARGHPIEQIVRGLVRSLTRRVAALARSAGISEPVMLSGGVARNPAVREFLAQELGRPVELPEHPQLMGAYGAALLAQAEK
ncbi:MAG TPA: acyl-CoA dehydratase activase [Myxococcota bacterium]|nr:acyl-CoA dehydratase activase [Myxococcota bacterium]